MEPNTLWPSLGIQAFAAVRSRSWLQNGAPIRRVLCVLMLTNEWKRFPNCEGLLGRYQQTQVGCLRGHLLHHSLGSVHPCVQDTVSLRYVQACWVVGKYGCGGWQLTIPGTPANAALC